MKITCVSHHATVRFAGEELSRYLKRMGGDGAAGDFVLGTFEELEPLRSTGEANSRWDDAVFIKSSAGRLFLGGPNPRSVLFSVYAYLESLGCRWLYPGPDGEEIPVAPVRVDGYDVLQRASSRFRGAAAYPDREGGEQYIDWMAKRRLNYFFSEYFLEERPGGTGISDLKSQISDDERRVISWKQAMLEAARRRGLLIELYGHGWSRGLVGRYAAEKRLTEEAAYEAIRARRSGDDLKAANVQYQEFCLSHPDVKRILVEHIGDFLEAHRDEQDVAGVWMGDGWDLACQCDRCRPRPFSAWYMDIVREVATRLKKTAPRLTIECLVYMTTLPAPDERPLDGLDNIIMMLAPMGRCYRHSLFDDACRHPDWKPDVRHNRSLDLEHFHHPLNGDYSDAARVWQQRVEAPWYIFDYFNWFQTSWSKSFLGYLPECLAEEAATLAEHGFAGMVPCHYTQSFFPTNLIMWTLAGVLWDRKADPRALRREYLEGQFGERASAAEAHMEAMRAALLRLTPHKTPLWQEEAAVLERVATELEALRDTFDQRFAGASGRAASPLAAGTQKDGAQGTARPTEHGAVIAARLFWLKADAVLQAGTFRALAEHAAGRDERAGATVKELLAFIDAHKTELDPALHVKFARWVVKWLPEKFKDRNAWVI